MYLILMLSSALSVELIDRELVNDIYAFKNSIQAIEFKDYYNDETSKLVKQNYNTFIAYHVSNMSNLNNKELEQLRVAIDVAFHVTFSKEYSLLYENTIAYQLGAISDQDIERAIHIHWVARDFKRMSSFARRLNARDYIEAKYFFIEPSFSYQSFATISVEGVELKITDKSQLLNEDYHLVVVSDIGCWFSRNLYHSYENAIQSGADFSGKITWLITQDSSVTPSELNRLKKEFPSIDFYLVYRNSDWMNHISFDQVPVVYSITNGEFELEIVGWAEENDAKELVDLVPASDW